MRSLAKHWATLCGLFLSGLYVYLQLVVWKKHGDDLMLTAANILVTCSLWAVLLVASATYFSRSKKIASESRQSQLTGAVIDQIKKIGTLESLAGRADWLGQYLEEVWHHFLKEKKNMPNPIGLRSMPDTIQDWTDKVLWRFRVLYETYVGSVKAVDPECDSELFRDGFPHEGEDYLSVKRKIEGHAEVLRKQASNLLASTKVENAKT